jgi:hypothetical protein
MTTEHRRTEEIKVEGKQLVSTIKRLVREGNVRRIVVRNPQGRTVVDIPLNAGIVGVALLPIWATLASLAMLVAQYTVVIERAGGPPAKPPVH